MVASTVRVMVMAFPTGVGMNRDAGGPAAHEWGVPHGRGDEPIQPKVANTAITAFPTGVGMNRAQQKLVSPNRRVPHGRGDEP